MSKSALACVTLLLLAHPAFAETPPPEKKSESAKDPAKERGKKIAQADVGQERPDTAQTPAVEEPKGNNGTSKFSVSLGPKGDGESTRNSIGGDARPSQALPGVTTSLGPLVLQAQGFFRAPLRMSWRERTGQSMEGEGNYNIRTPWLVDDDYFRSGFAYTRLQESDWAELFLSGGNKWVTGTVAFMASLYSDAARPLLDRQWGIAQGYVTLK